MPIPPEINEIYEELKTEIVWLHGRWIIYRQLYAESEKRIDLLNRCAGTFFYIVQDILIGDVQVTLSKLTDPARSGTFDNLSLGQLDNRIEKYGDETLKAQLDGQLDRVKALCEPFRTWRNKRLAHLDLKTAMKSSLDPLPGVSRKMIEDALRALREYMNEIEGYYHDSTFGYEHFAMQSDGAALVAMLKYGVRYEELLDKKQLPYDDWRHSSWKDA